ncbi:hypothetical protein HMPREF9374_2728 [Desmospora sp. 8437]|nr:hypothetical protein HMPREF9374_2728 [Desmospora sp. 8437]
MDLPFSSIAIHCFPSFWIRDAEPDFIGEGRQGLHNFWGSKL